MFTRNAILALGQDPKLSLLSCKHSQNCVPKKFQNQEEAVNLCRAFRTSLYIHIFKPETIKHELGSLLNWLCQKFSVIWYYQKSSEFSLEEFNTFKSPPGNICLLYLFLYWPDFKTHSGLQLKIITSSKEILSCPKIDITQTSINHKSKTVAQFQYTKQNKNPNFTCYN